MVNREKSGAVEVEPSLTEFIFSEGLAPRGAALSWFPLTGGVSSDIWRVDTPAGSLCVKRALSQLKVSDDWQAPLSRNAYEWQWLTFATRHSPRNVPRLLAHDPQLGVFAMAYLEPAEHPVWKAQLMQGVVAEHTARAVAEAMGRLHAASAKRSDIARQFDTTDNFYALRLEPYLLATAQKHPRLKTTLTALAERTAATRLALVHGDISPKNILLGARGPVILDAECAWYGDPAFDLAFCLNHLLLKCLVNPGLTAAYLRCFDVLAGAYLEHCTWEPDAQLEQRAASLLPALLLARVDGKSPVEYLTENEQRERVRAAAVPLLDKSPGRLEDVKEAWRKTMES